MESAFLKDLVFFFGMRNMLANFFHLFPSCLSHMLLAPWVTCLFFFLMNKWMKVWFQFWSSRTDQLHIMPS